MISLKEIYTALVTPFDNTGHIDFENLYKLIQSLLDQGNHKFVICGTTGEVSTLSSKEKRQLIQFVLYHFNQADFIFGVSGNNTQDIIEQIQDLEDIVVCFPFMIVVPYYNKPNQAGLYQHFSTIASATQRDIILYNVPSRCSCTLEDETIIKLAKKHKNIIGLKQAGDYTSIATLKTSLPFFKIYIGNDDLLLEGIEQGIDGIISVCSHVSYPLIKEIFDTKDAVLDGKLKEIARLVFKDASPAPIKYMLYRKKLIHNILRLPLVTIDATLEQEIDQHM